MLFQKYNSLLKYRHCSAYEFTVTMGHNILSDMLHFLLDGCISKLERLNGSKKCSFVDIHISILAATCVLSLVALHVENSGFLECFH